MVLLFIYLSEAKFFKIVQTSAIITFEIRFQIYPQYPEKAEKPAKYLKFFKTKLKLGGQNCKVEELHCNFYSAASTTVTSAEKCVQNDILV